MIRIDVDYNARDADGRVVARVPDGQLARLHQGLPVSLYDPVDRLWADATVAWIDSKTGAIGFDVDWTSFVEGSLSQPQLSVRSLQIDYSESAIPLSLVPVLSHSGEFTVIHEGLVSHPAARRLSEKLYKLLNLGKHKSSQDLGMHPLVFDYFILLVQAEDDRTSSSTDAASLHLGWEMAER